MATETTRPMWVLSEEETGLAAHLERLRSASRLAVDTESDPFHRYYEKVCLIQISTPTEDYLVDPLANGLVPEIREILSDSGRVLVLHGADYDVRALKQSFELTLGTLFDTSVAAQFLGLPNTGLKALVETHLGVEIDKGEQRSDWGQRPLTHAQLAYARQDTMHLLALADLLEAKLRDAQRLAWLHEECELLRARPPVQKTFDPEGWRKLKGTKDLHGRGRRALRAAYVWRERVAQEADKPPFRIIRNDQLLRLARMVDQRGPRGLERLKRLDFLPKGLDRTALGRAVAEGLEGPDPGERRKASPAGPARTPHSAESKALLGRLREGRLDWARDLGMDPGFLVSSATLDQVARTAPRTIAELADVTGMTSWRIEAVGAQIMETLRL